MILKQLPNALEYNKDGGPIDAFNGNGGNGGNSFPQNDYVQRSELAEVAYENHGLLTPLYRGIIDFTKSDDTMVYVGTPNNPIFSSKYYFCILNYDCITANPKSIVFTGTDSNNINFNPYFTRYHCYCKEKDFSNTIFKCRFVVNSNYLDIYLYELDYFTDNIFYPAYYMKTSSNNDYYYVPYRIHVSEYTDFICPIVIYRDFQYTSQNNNRIVFVDYEGNEKTAENLYINDVDFVNAGNVSPKLLKGTYICKYFSNTDSFKIYSIDLSNLIVS